MRKFELKAFFSLYGESVKNTFLYLIIGGAWITFSDRLLHTLISNAELLTFFLSIKGWFYIVVTSILIFVLYSKRITEISEKRAQKELSESEEWYRKLFDLTPDPVVIYKNNEIMHANRAFSILIGADHHYEIVIGKSIYPFIHPTDWNMVQERIYQMEKHRAQLEPAEIKIITLCGSLFIVGEHATPITINGTDCILSIWRDVTAKKAVEEQLREKRKKYQLIAQNMKDLVSVFDPNGLMTYASPSHETMLGIPPSALLGTASLQIVHPEDVQMVMDKFQQLRNDRVETNVEFRLLHDQGHEIMVEATCSVIENEKGELEGILIASRDISERKRFEEQLKELAYYDSLTGLPNRRYFEDHFGRAATYATRHNQDLALLFMDLDGFKKINDAFGHDAGDEVLIQFATVVEDCIRKTDIFARLGGDEFVILIYDCNEQDVIRVANKIIVAVQKQCSNEDKNICVSTSIGISMYPKDGVSYEGLMKQADEAMYRAKTAGKNQMMFCAP